MTAGGRKTATNGRDLAKLVLAAVRDAALKNDMFLDAPAIRAAIVAALGKNTWTACVAVRPGDRQKLPHYLSGPCPVRRSPSRRAMCAFVAASANRLFALAVLCAAFISAQRPYVIMHLQAPIHMVALRVYTAHVVVPTKPRRVAVRAQEYGAPAMKDTFNKARDSLARHYRYGVNFATKVQALAAFPDVWAASASPKAMAVRARPPLIAFHTNRLPAFFIMHAPGKHRNCRPPPPPPPLPRLGAALT